MTLEANYCELAASFPTSNCKGGFGRTFQAGAEGDSRTRHTCFRIPLIEVTFPSLRPESEFSLKNTTPFTGGNDEHKDDAVKTSSPLTRAAKVSVTNQPKIENPGPSTISMQNAPTLPG